MKALAWFGTDDVRVIEAGIPDIVDPDDVVLVSVLATKKKNYGELILCAESYGVYDLRLRLASLPRRNHGSSEGRHSRPRGAYL